MALELGSSSSESARNGVPRASHDLPGQGLYDCSGGSMSSANQDPRPKLVLYEGSFKKDLGRWGRSIGPEPRAHMGLGISVPYISPPLIHTRLSGRIKEPTELFGLGSPMAWDSCGYGFSLMLISKDVLFRSARFSCHYCLTVHEPKRRACQLSLASAGSFVNRAHLLLD